MMTHTKLPVDRVLVPSRGDSGVSQTHINLHRSSVILKMEVDVTSRYEDNIVVSGPIYSMRQVGIPTVLSRVFCAGQGQRARESTKQ